MSETIGSENSVSRSALTRNEHAEAKFFKDAEKMIVETESDIRTPGAAFDNVAYPNADSLVNKNYLRSKHGATG